MDKFAALSDPNRRRIVELLASQGRLTSGAISSYFHISAPAVSQHLKVLREAEILRVEKRAQQRIYSLNPDGVDEMWEWLGRLRGFWNTKFNALEEFLAEEEKNDP
jgi:DNA-binding transcriptional ArsR family regulator|tara:strand:+ start:260 stop:577 length:318 start_codon:yes stop_codon:yes gene_type:complete